MFHIVGSLSHFCFYEPTAGSSMPRGERLARRVFPFPRVQDAPVMDAATAAAALARQATGYRRRLWIHEIMTVLDRAICPIPQAWQDPEPGVPRLTGDPTMPSRGRFHDVVG